MWWVLRSEVKRRTDILGKFKNLRAKQLNAQLPKVENLKMRICKRQEVDELTDLGGFWSWRRLPWENLKT